MADLNRIESFQYPSAHFGHLSDNQQAQLDAFKLLCQKEGYYTPAGATEASYDDETLLRFLRARRFNHAEAFKQFKDTEDWRKEHDVNGLFSKIDIEEFEQTRRLYPQWLGRRDKRGIPVYLFCVAPLNTKNISAYEKNLAKATLTSPKVSTKNLRLFALYESLTRFVMPLCSAIDRKHPETPISQSNNIVDITGVGLKQFWNLKNHMQDASVLATAHYPETLDRIFIVGAPAFFPTVWGWVKRWFDPITVSKIFILSSANILPTLSQYIDPENIPKQYGGKLDFEWGMMPVLEPEIQSAIKWESPNVQAGGNTFPIGPIMWEREQDGSMKAVAIGSENGKPRRRVIFSIPDPVGAKLRGQAIPNTPIDERELELTTVGTATHPPATDDSNVDVTPPTTDSSSPALTPPFATTAEAAVVDQSSLPLRQGTSDTRFEQQQQTHAADQLAQGTPHSAVNDHGHGDKTVTMEPNTVGQAPKDVSIPSVEAPAPGNADQAKQVASQAAGVVTWTVGSATGAVAGLVNGAKAEEKVDEKVPEKSPEQKALNGEIAGKEDPAIEDFLRTHTTSSNAVS
ncbi:CRAL/TRIO domain-containing protein [Pleomassaria siparia CBS 279.74]|uniref:CRAL/TRIO domain-containing protein n=1 Tax=Pleomassaria siparia CBS 279.74 TaxID=1314801 RepID=A0A6G1KNJ4_9PLEO|nr:CRAL/TRIO domain-containing protein [Pleomassaria siparia CBS 279.74]